MTITYTLAPEPVWVLINLEGTVAGGGYIVSKRSLNKIEDKPIFMDGAGSEAWPNPVFFDLNGVQGPFYFEVDSANLDDTYFLQAFDSEDNLLWEADDFFPSGSGGGGTSTTFLPLKNYINNNQFIDHIADTVTTSLTNLVIAPSNHKGFTPAVANPVTTNTYGVVGPDIRFLKDSTANTDNISFPLFALASPALSPDVTPVDYVRYQCTTGNVGESFKCFQFPITQKIKNLSNQVMTFKIWAAVTATPVNLTAYVRQYFGSGTAASSEVRTTIGTLSLTTTWTPFLFSFTVPDVAGKSIGTPGLQTDDDAIYVQLQMPLNSACDILFVKPALYLGTVNPDKEFDDYDQINSINSTPRTADIRVSLTPSAPNGWVAMNDGTIGNVGSGATNRANADTFQLYSTIYTSVIDTWAPVSTGRTAPGNTMAAAITDFLAGKKLTLPLSLGRALAGFGTGAGLTARVLGQNTGAETVALTGPNLPAGTPYNPAAGTGDFVFTSAGPAHVPGNNAGSAWQFGTATATSIMQPTSFMNIFIKL